MRFLAVAILFVLAGCGSGSSSMPLAVSNPNSASTPELIATVREFTIPANVVGTNSIITGPDGKIWFTEYGAIGTVTTGGTFHIVNTRGGSIPGMLTIGPDGNVWASAASEKEPHTRGGDNAGTPFIVYRVTPSFTLRKFALPVQTSGMPTNISIVNSQMYLAYFVITTVSGSTAWVTPVDALQTNGQMRTVFTPPQRGQMEQLAESIATPDSHLWLFDFGGGMRICTTSGTCTFVQEAKAGLAVDNLNPMELAYSPKTHDVYIYNYGDSGTTASIEQLTLQGKRLHGFKSPLLDDAFGTLAYHAGDIWVALGNDSQGHPTVGRLTPTQRFAEIALSVSGKSERVTAMGTGPDGKLWYVRGHHVGEILSISK